MVRGLASIVAVGALVLVSGSQPAPWIVEDFSEYDSTDALLRYPNPLWSGPTEDVNPAHIALDTDSPPSGGKSMRYDQPDRSADPNLCHDYTIGRNLQFPTPAREIWVELYGPSFRLAIRRSFPAAAVRASRAPVTSFSLPEYPPDRGST